MSSTRVNLLRKALSRSVAMASVTQPNIRYRFNTAWFCRLSTLNESELTRDLVKLIVRLPYRVIRRIYKMFLRHSEVAVIVAAETLLERGCDYPIFKELMQHYKQILGGIMFENSNETGGLNGESVDRVNNMLIDVDEEGYTSPDEDSGNSETSDEEDITGQRLDEHIAEEGRIPHDESSAAEPTRYLANDMAIQNAVNNVFRQARNSTCLKPEKAAGRVARWLAREFYLSPLSYPPTGEDITNAFMALQGKSED